MAGRVGQASMDGNGWAAEIDGFMVWLAAEDRPETTRALRRHQLRRAGRELDGGPWVQDVDSLAGWLGGHGWATETIRSHRSALATFYGWGYRTGRIDQDVAAGLPHVSASRRLPRPAADVVWRSALDRADERCRLILMLGAMEGLRRGEIAQVHTRDVMQGIDGWSLRVRGKGRRDRIVPLHPEVASAVRRCPSGWVFPGQVGGHLSPAHVGRLASAALGDGTTLHQLRHRFATEVYAGSRDLLAVQQLLGHSKPETTMGYVALAGSGRDVLRWAA